MTALIHRKNFLGARATCLYDARARVGEPRGPREDLPLNREKPDFRKAEIRWTPWSI